MRVIIRGGDFSPETDLQPTGEEFWTGGADDLPAAVLAAMDANFELGTWYATKEFENIVSGMKPLPAKEEVSSTIPAEQAGVGGKWQAQMEIGQSQAALMVCRALCDYIRRYQEELRWIRVE
ncbi:hypothetical protein [Mesorhizobium sp. B2-7-1]|uniref:hypothetical protein n=1 Tax=Mesorhizobium sp. B2-7-1 TaxID=2589909 RepID=UPI00112AA188|nr:hypothetical protein [Mesorhizobium sp. B2-7-1]TPJ62780.1 hypothetical protein FJ471_16345 [Mesorhizobium sp. B2-7-1]